MIGWKSSTTSAIRRITLDRAGERDAITTAMFDRPSTAWTAPTSTPSAVSRRCVGGLSEPKLHPREVVHGVTEVGELPVDERHEVAVGDDKVAGPGVALDQHPSARPSWDCGRSHASAYAISISDGRRHVVSRVGYGSAGLVSSRTDSMRWFPICSSSSSAPT